ncbi:hypothetical protein GYMLUDRAFT_188733 [Collybiopsis luxurians FD-317 M1]|nr:hypothetical protein GYMLUDRAFT_188733 [Collybiopsis luxurians FD-317 M1]
MVYAHAQNADEEDLLGSDGSEFLDEINMHLVKSPLTTPRKPPKKVASRPATTNTVRATKSTEDSISQSPVSRRSTNPTSSIPIMSRVSGNSNPTRGPSREIPVIYISSDEEDVVDTEVDSDSASSLFDRSSLSRQDTMSSTTSFPSPLSRSTSVQSDDFFSSGDSTISPPSLFGQLTLSPAQSFKSSRGDPFSEGSSSSRSSSISSASSPSIKQESASSTLAPVLKTLPNFYSSPLKALFPSGDAKLHIDVHLISHDTETQKLFDNPRGLVPWGTQFELARGAQLKEWTWERVREKIDNFAGKSDAEVMHLVKYIMNEDTPPKSSNTEIGVEYDREQLAILENSQRGLGLSGDYLGATNWFGGQIQQVVILEELATGKLRLRLEPVEMRRSTRFARQFGSRRVLQVRIADEFLRGPGKARMIKFLTRKFILNGRVYAPTPPKESAVYLVEINEDYERVAVEKFGDLHRKSLGEVLEWHNPMRLNSQQPISKYAARAALALSNSMPALIFKVENIHFIDDIVASDCRDKKPPAHKVLTDGCGFINETAMKDIASALNYHTRPTAVQGRIAGSKGLWTLHPFDKSDEPHIWIRDSQRKIVYPHFNHKQGHRVHLAQGDCNLCRGHYTTLDRAHCIFDLCHAALPSLSTSGSMVALKKQSVLNLWANGVQDVIFKELMEKGLEEMIRPLTQWESGEFAMPALWDAINRNGKVSHVRTSRLAAAKARALGLAGRDYKRDGAPDDQDTGGRNETSGVPFSLHETALELVQAGFHPSQDSMLWDALQWILKTTVAGAIEKCSIPLPEGSATSAFVIPDPIGALDENEIFFRFSTPVKDPATQTLFHVVTGEVLIGRYPFRVRSDIQKVRAVDIPELHRYSDVIIVPTKPSRSLQGLVSLMSKCSGGDHDGDELILIWTKVLVEAFQVSELVVPPEGISSSFETQVKRVAEFLDEIGEKHVADAQKIFISSFLGGLSDSSVGLYDTFHEKAVRLHGYASEQAERLAFLFNDLLDSAKTGKVLRAEVREKDGEQSRTFEAELKKKESDESDFIYDKLQAFGEKLLKMHEEKFNKLPPPSQKSDILLEPYKKAQRLCQAAALPPDVTKYIPSACRISLDDIGRGLQAARQADLRMIEQHVNRAYVEFAIKCKSIEKKSGSKSKKKAMDEKAKDRRMDSVIRAYASDIPGLTGALPDIDHVKASYAYSKGEKFNFAKTVAFRSLCEIQVAASGEGGAPCSRLLDQVKSISGGARRLFQ